MHSAAQTYLADHPIDQPPTPNHHPKQFLLFDPGELESPAYRLAFQLFEDHIAAGQKSGRLKKRTIDEYRVSQRRFADWAARYPGLSSIGQEDRSATPILIIYAMQPADQAAFFQWVADQSTGKNIGRVVNKRREHFVAIRNRLEKRSAQNAPPFPRLADRWEQQSARQKVTMSRAEVGRIYQLAASLPTPPSWPKNVGPIGTYWQAAVVLFVSLGLDTGTIWPEDPTEPTALRWKGWFETASPPTRNDDTTNRHGWLLYTRKKNGATMQRPCNPQMAYQLHRLKALQPKAKPDDLIFPSWNFSKGWEPCDLFRILCQAAQVPEAVDAKTLRRLPWILQYLRKTAGTWANTAVPGSGSALLAHRSGQLAAVTEAHYVDCSPLAARAILETPMPTEFPVTNSMRA